jgi:acetyltransferase-like isoleucine patch superfamily enzyme
MNKLIYSLRFVNRLIKTYFLKFKVNLFSSNQVGNNCLFGTKVKLGGDVNIGHGGYIGQYSYIGPKTRIGNFCLFSDNVNIVGSDHDFNNIVAPIILSGRPSEQPLTIIGDDVWLGHGVVIMRGVNIGNGAIVGANSVVTKNIESCCIYAGSPASKIRDRFNSKVKLTEYKDMLNRFNLDAQYISNSKFLN